jgi:hypothetical protein
MPIINNAFNGKLNLDSANYRISNGDFIDALNITRDAEGSAQDKVISNILGNSNVAYTLPAGTNKVIGFYADKIRNRAYYFIWNSNGYNTILYLNADTNAIVKVLESKTDSDGIDILSFNPSYKVLSINIFYRDDEGDIMFFNDGYNPPKNINVEATYGTSWKLEYLLVAKAPPTMPPKVTYENDTTITINNLRNKLFQFSYRFVYDNNEKSVWSSKSIVPLPQQPTLEFTDNTATNNSRIAVLFSTGGANVKSIELCFRETSTITSDWYLIKSFDKSSLSISDNDIYKFKFYNDSIYTQLDIIDTDQLQDWVPQKANAAELANGNVLLYAGIVEGYDKTTMDLSVAQSLAEETAFFYDQAGILLLATVNGTDNGSGTLMNIYLYGTGTNGGSGEVVTLNNAAGGYYINSFSASGTDLSTSYSTSGLTSSYLVSDILAGISAAMVLKGYTQVSLVGNKLVMSLSTGFVLTSVGFKTFPLIDSDNTRFANVWDSGYQYAIQYFDAQGRTIGAQTSIGGSINTPSINLDATFPIITLSVLNRPPLYATSYQVLRSNNTTYNKRLCWVSESAYSGINSDESDIRYFYIGIDNIAAYNESISSTQNVVSYSYTEGDRIRFLRRYNVSNEPVEIPSQFDYEIVGTVASFEYNITLPAPLLPDNNTYTATGNFLKIRYPYDDISTDFRFPGTADFQHYEILLYNYTTNADLTQRFFYEFGKAYGIGNPGSSTRYHFGMTQLANGGATIPVTNGDLFYRLRNVPVSDSFNYISSVFDIATSGSFVSGAETFPITVDDTIDNDSYKIQTQPGATAYPTGGSFPVWSSTGYFFYNKSSTYEKTVSINGSFIMSSDGASTFSVYAIVCTNLAPYTAKYTISLLPIEVNDIVQNTPTEFTIKKKFSVPPTGKIWIVAESTNDNTGSNNIIIQPMNFDFQVIKTTLIGIIESSFNDTFNLVTNSNGRPSIIDENARQAYYPTLIRFGQAYQSNTNINATNRFYFENFDEYDRSFGDVMRLHVRDRYLKVYQKFKVGNVPILTQIVKDVSGNPLQANTDQLINKIQYYAGDYGIGDASTSLAWNNFADYFVDDYRGVVCRLAQDGITPISITNSMNSFFVAKLKAYRQSLNNGYGASGTTSDYYGNPCIYGAFDAYTNKYIISLEEINRYSQATSTTTTTSTTSTTTIAPTTTTTAPPAPTTTTTTFSNNPCNCVEVNITSVGGEVATFNCYGVNENYVYPTAGTRYICAAVIGGLLQAEIVSGTGTITPVGNCKTGACPPGSTTTTTTRASGTQFGISTTTKYGTEVLACNGTITGTVYQDPAYGNTPTNGQQLYTDSNWSITWTPSPGAGIYLMQFGGSTKWAVSIGSTGIIESVTACSTTTTTTASPTTTTTASPTTTTTTTVAQVNFDISYTCNPESGDATVTVNNFTGGSGAYKINNSLSLTSGATDTTPFVNVVGSSVEFFNVSDNTWYVQVRDQADNGNYRIKSIEVDCIVPDDCVCWTVYNPTAGSLTVDYYACDGTQPIIGVPGGSTNWICVIRGTTPVDVEGGGLVITQCSPEVICTIANPMCNDCSNQTTTTTTTTTTAAAPPAYKYLVNGSPSVSSSIACGTTKNIYLWSYADTFTDLVTYYEGDVTSPTLPLVVYAGDSRWKSNGVSAVQIDDFGYATNLTSCPVTTTTTAAPTTTTTAAPTTTTTTAAITTYSVELCGGGEGPFIVTLATGDTPSGIGQSYKLSKTTSPFDGIKCWEVLEVNPVGSVDYANVAFGTVFSNCLECNPITTTSTSTTTTAAPTTTTTTQAPTTTTTSSTTSTTTTKAPGTQFGISTTTKYGTEGLACNGTITGTVYQDPAYGNTPTSGQQLYTDSNWSITWTPSPGAGIYLMQFGGSTKWAVSVGSTGIIGSVTACSGITTTTTTTAAPTTTTTTLAPTTTTTTAAPTTTTTTTAAPTTFTIAWSLTDVTTGTANMEIYKNSSLIVNQSGTGSGSFTVISSDVVYYTLSGTSPDFTYVDINDSVHGVISACNFNSANVNSFPGSSYTTNATVDGVAINYIDGCP